MSKLICLILLMSCAAAFALDTGDKAANFTLTATDGKKISLSDYSGKNVMIVFLATRCPYSRAFQKTIAEVASNYSPKGLVVLGINSNGTEPLEEVKLHAKENFPFPVLKDEGNKVADLYKAQVTPEVYLIDTKGNIRYHGAVGNSSSPTTDASEANANEVNAAIDALLAGKQIAKGKTKAFGCTIKRV